jgi:O-acetylserine/cysteine efflux transporter
MPQNAALPRLHLLLAIAVMAVWGTNFVVIKLALAHLQMQKLVWNSCAKF